MKHHIIAMKFDIMHHASIIACINHYLQIGVHGEHGGDPMSIHFFDRIGMDYVSCSPYRIPVAKVAAAQAHIWSTSGERLMLPLQISVV